MDRALSTHAAPPHLRTVSSAVLARAGYTLASASVPPYCGAVQSASVQGWVSGSLGGCPISVQAADAAVFPGGGRTVLETLLARVSAAGGSPVERDRLAWVVVVRYSSLLMPMYLCPVPAIGMPCPAAAPGFAATDVIVVDAGTGQQLAVVRVTSNGALAAPSPAPGAGTAQVAATPQ
jgi:hypothetical protein